MHPCEPRIVGSKFQRHSPSRNPSLDSGTRGYSPPPAALTVLRVNFLTRKKTRAATEDAFYDREVPRSTFRLNKVPWITELLPPNPSGIGRWLLMVLVGSFLLLGLFLFSVMGLGVTRASNPFVLLCSPLAFRFSW